MKRVIVSIICLMFLTAGWSQQADGSLQASLGGYCGVGYTLRGLSGATAVAGASYRSHGVQVAYTLGLASTPDIYWYDGNGVFQSGLNYKLSSFALHYGYSFQLHEQLSVAPQLGWQRDWLSGRQTAGTANYGHRASANHLTIGALLRYEPLHHAGLFLIPQYALPLSKDDVFDTVAGKADFTVGGLSLTAGIIFSF